MSTNIQPPPSASDLLARNATTLANYTPKPNLGPEMAAAGIGRPSIVIVTCADPRCVPEQFFDLKMGDAVVLRTAGGRVRPVLRDILVLDSYLGRGQLRELLLVQHTDCGASHLKSEVIKEDYTTRFPKHKDEITTWETGSFDNRSNADVLKEDIAFIKCHEMVSDDVKKGVQGFVFDIKTGRVNPI